MNIELLSQQLVRICPTDKAEFIESIQSLWSGYGEIVRFRLLPTGETVVVKFVNPPDVRGHKYGWSGDVSHERKLSSYQNELAWYRETAAECDDSCRVARLLASESEDGQWLFVMEDLDASGFPIRTGRVNEVQLQSCLSWLASFHARFMSTSGSPGEQRGLWPIGTYWHLDTRPEEFATMPEGALKEAAEAIDEKLNNAKFRTLVHGDAKLANFCFSRTDSVAAVDFQYVGGGCGMKDVAYFISSCFDDDECERRESELLDLYFGCLRQWIESDTLADEIEAEWRSLYSFAWADFYRFLAGWSPGHWKIHGYSRRKMELVLQRLAEST
ncbi:MAG: phosphotransferase [Planctomycetota bacterium]